MESGTVMVTPESEALRRRVEENQREKASGPTF